MHLSHQATPQPAFPLTVEIGVLQAGGVRLAGPVSLCLQAGQLVWLRGANGVGKSTLLRRMAQHFSQRAVLLTAEGGLRSELTALEHVQVLLKLWPSQVTAQQLLDFVGLADWAHEPIAALSSGQRTRLSLCILQLHPSDVWLLDEPLNTLDDEGIALLGRMLQNLLGRGGVVILASHQPIAPRFQIEAIEWIFRAGVISTPVDEGGGGLPSLQPVSMLNHLSPSLLQGLAWREYLSVIRAPQQVLWGALFHWVVLGFFGLVAGPVSAQLGLALLWVSALLAMLLAGAQWFEADYRSRWWPHLMTLGPLACVLYWCLRCGLGALLQILALLPVSLVAAVQLDIPFAALLGFLIALPLALMAVAPLLGLLSLLVMMTRGGLVLIYIMALPLLVPVLLFGMEASRADLLGRSPAPAWWVLGLLACLGFLLGPVVGRALIKMLNE